MLHIGFAPEQIRLDQRYLPRERDWYKKRACVDTQIQTCTDSDKQRKRKSNSQTIKQIDRETKKKKVKETDRLTD